MSALLRSVVPALARWALPVPPPRSALLLHSRAHRLLWERARRARDTH